MTSFIRGLILKIFYPLFTFIGSFLKNKREILQAFIININNKIVKKNHYKAKRILILLPHCLQVSDCDVRITHNIYNCKRCGRCSINDLIKIAEENNINIFVATGGTIARRIVKETMPDAIIAVACERDLSSGIVDTYPLPVIGILNERPCGPCINTQVDLLKIKEAIDFFIK